MISYKSIPPNMQCHLWSNLNENPGEKYLRLFSTFETSNLWKIELAEIVKSQYGNYFELCALIFSQLK